MKRILAPSILAADFTKLGDEIRAVKEGGAPWLHIDVMDGLFVPSISFGQPVVKSLRPASDLFFDVHMMVQDPGRYVEDFHKAGADGITVHAEACTHLDRTLEMIRERGIRAGVALNPATPLSALDYVYGRVDMILVMTVNPGFGGQAMIPAMYEKVRTLRGILREKGLEEKIDIQVDGGINTSTIGRAAEAGANVIVAGSASFGEDTCGNVKKLISLMEA